MRCVHKSIPDQLRPGLLTTASGVAQQGTSEYYATAEHSENKRRRVKRQREVWKERYFVFLPILPKLR